MSWEEEIAGVYAALANGAFRAQACERCRRMRFYPKRLCPACGDAAYRWLELDGEGVIYSYTTIPEVDGERHIGLVELAPGVRPLGVLELDSEPRIDQPVRFVGRDAESGALRFSAADTAPGRERPEAAR